MIRKVLAAVLMIIATATHSQQYNFDLLTLYSTDTDGYKFDRLIYSNTKNTKLFLIVEGNPGSKDATLYDLGSRKMHHFDVLEPNHDQPIQYNYVKSANFAPPLFDAHDFTIENLKPDGQLKKVKITLYKSGKTKMIAGTQTLTMKKSSANFFQLYRVSGFHPYEFWEKLQLDGNYMVVKSTGKSYIGHDFSAELVLEKKVDLRLQIPK